MSKGSRQRTYGAKFDENWERIFGSKREASEKAPKWPSERDLLEGRVNPQGMSRIAERADLRPLEPCPGMDTSALE